MKNKGRPPRHEDELLGRNRTFRIRASLDDMLIAAAKVSGRSVSSEIEYRLQQSFDPTFTAQQLHDVATTVTTTVLGTIDMKRHLRAKPAPEIPDEDRE